MSKKSTFTFLFIGVLLSVTAQDLHWADQFGGTGFDSGYGLSVDLEGNVVTVGSFQGTADFDPGPGQVEMTSAGFDDIYITKLDDAGDLLWAKQFGGPSFDIGFDVAVDPDGSVYTTGYFSETVDFDPGPASFNLTSAGLYDCFISKLDSEGNFVWAKKFGGEQFEMGYSITLDNAGNVILTGRFNGMADFDPDAGVSTMTPSGSYDAFVAKLHPSGALVWARQFGGSVDDEGHGIEVDDAGNVYTTGFFWGVADFDPSEETFNLTSQGNFDIYVSKIDSNGDFVWVKQLGGDMEDQGLAIAMDNSDNLLLTGYFSGTADFDPGTPDLEMTSAGSFDAYICKLDNNGFLVWVKQLGSFGEDKGYSIATDSEGSVYSCGSFEFGVDFDPGAGSALFLSNGAEDAYQVILDASGEHMWSAQIGGGSDDRALSIALDANDNIYSAGYFQLTADFDPSDQNHELTAFANYDAFVQKLQQCTASAASFSATACGSYDSPSGNYTWTSSGIYMDTIPNSTGCDSVLTIDLTIENVNVGVTQTADMLTADAEGASYQWIICGGEAIPDAGEQSYTPTSTGSFAVIVTIDNCTDTSECVVWTVGIEEIDITDEISYQVNSSSGTLLLDLGREYHRGSIIITSISGQVHERMRFAGNQYLTMAIPTSPGVYLVRIIADGKVGVLRIVQER